MVNPKANQTSLASLPSAKGEVIFGVDAVGAADIVNPQTVRIARDKLSVTTLEELAALGRLDRRAGTSHLAETLEVDPESVRRFVRTFEERNPETLEAWRRMEAEEYAGGMEEPLAQWTTDEEHAFGKASTGAFAAAAPPKFVNLIIPSMPPVGEQGHRVTCTAFVGTACLEYARAMIGAPRIDLSEQFLFWRTVASSGGIRDLTFTFRAMAAGICPESDWAYVPTVVPGNETQGPPPPQAVQGAVITCPTPVHLNPRSIAAFKNAMLNKRLVAIGFPIYASWYGNAQVRLSGNIGMPHDGEAPSTLGGHAVALAGYADNPAFSGGGYFIVRNCWDSRWGITSPFGAGYGTIPFKFITNYNWDAWCVG